MKNVFAYAQQEELYFRALAQQICYEPKTTFFSDLSIAELYGVESIKDTFARVVSEWLKDCQYFTEFVMCLNWKSWEFYDRGNDTIAKLYSALYHQADELAMETYTGDDLDYYYSTTD